MNNTASAAPRPPRSMLASWPGFLFAALLAAAIVTIALTLAGRTVVFGSANTSLVDQGASAEKLARRVHESGAAEAVTDDQLRTIVDAIRQAAEAGDTRAALFMFELARQQRTPAAP